MNHRLPRIVDSIEKMLLAMAVFVALYAPAWVLLGGGQGSAYLIAALVLLCINPLLEDMRSFLRLSVAKTLLAPIASFVFVMSLLVYLIVQHQTEDFTLITQFLTAAVVGGVLGYLVHKKFTQFGWKLESLLWMLALVTTFQSVCIVLDWWLPSIRTFFELLVIHPEQLEQSAYRASGFSSITGDGLAFFQAIGAAFCIALWIKPNSLGARAGLSLMFLLNLLSIVYLARTGFVLLSVFLVVYMALSGLKWKSAQFVLWTGFLFAAIAIAAYFSEPELVKETIQGNQIRYAFEFLFNFIEQGSISTGSSDELFTMFVLPESVAGLWFGEGHFKHIGMDPGYIRTIWAVGLLGSLAIYGWFVYVWLILNKSVGKDREIKVLIAGFFVMLFVSHLKFPFLYLTQTLFLLSLLYWTLTGRRGSK